MAGTVSSLVKDARKDSSKRTGRKKKIAGPEDWKSLLTTLASLSGKDAIIREKIIAYSVTSPFITIPARNILTGSPHLQVVRWEAIGPFCRPISLRYEAEKAFFAENIVFVESFESLKADITPRFLPEIKRLYVNFPADISTIFRQKAVQKLHDAITAALSDCSQLEWLIVAVTYENVSARQSAMGKTLWPELRTLVAALRMLEVERKFVLLCREEDYVEANEKGLMVKKKANQKTVEWSVANAEVGTAFEV